MPRVMVNCLPLVSSTACSPLKRGWSSLIRSVFTSVERLIRAFAPERIVLFGSYAKGTRRIDSDVDLLVASGVELCTWRLPAELFEPRFGDRINHDDLLDFHELLKRDDWFDTVVEMIRK